MTSIEVIDPGLLSSVQDLGRFGFRADGVPGSGAFDVQSHSLGNRLLGNEPSDASIEMTMIGGSFLTHADCIICLTGAEATNAYLIEDGTRNSISARQPIAVPAGTEIHIGRLSHGLRAYLCVRGGIQTPCVLGSRSALVSLPGIGLGRSLRKGDQLPLHAALMPDIPSSTASVSCTPHWIEYRALLRIVPSVHTQLFSDEQRDALVHSEFEISNQSNRSGVRFAGSPLPAELPERIRSCPVLPGFIQVPPSGDPIVLGVDGPTTGGYPIIASVIEADLPRLAQLSPRERVQLQWVDHKQALVALRESGASS
jgi:urea carboxylase